MRTTEKVRRALLIGMASMALPGKAEAQTAPEPATMGPVRLVVSVDTFAMVVQGDTVATQVVALERTSGGFLFREETRGRMGHQRTTVRVSLNGAPQWVTQRGEASGREMRIDVTYENGRAEGAAVVPGPDGMREVVVDAEVPPEVIDDNTLIAMLPGLRLEPGREFKLPVFASGTGALTGYTVEVSETDPVTVAGRTHEALAARASAGAQVIRFLVTRAAPHKVLRIEPPGPVRVVRISAVR